MMFQSILSATGRLTIGQVLACTIASILSGVIISLVFQYKNKTTRGLSITLVLLPVLVQMVILMVNGNLGTGVAIMGAFSLVRFRSNPGNARDICAVFFAMATGLSTGMGYLTFAGFMVVIVCVTYLILTQIHFGEGKEIKKQLRVTIPENLNYVDVFDDLFEKYTSKTELQKVKTTNMGSMYELTYAVLLKDEKNEKAFIDELRCRNGNLTIVCGRMMENQESL